MAARTCPSSLPDPLRSGLPPRHPKVLPFGDATHLDAPLTTPEAARPLAPEERNRRLAAALDQVGEAMALVDAGSGTILYHNGLFLRMFGAPRFRSSGWTISACLESPVLCAALEGAREGRTWTGRATVRTASGRNVAAEGSISPVRATGGAVESLLVRLRDISQELEEDHQQLQTQKMDALGVLAGGLAHDFNNLIGAILNAAELIELQVGADSPIQPKLEIIQRVGGRARELSSQILNFSRRTDEKWRPFDLADLAAEAISVLEATLPRNVEIRSRLTEGITVFGEPSQWHQVLMNLGINASQAMQPTGGVLAIDLVHEELDPRVVDQLYTEPCALLVFTDTGCGMGEETLEHIFEPFFTTKGVGHGTGLGLSLTYGIIQRHQGHLHVTSKPGQGSTFKIRLPLHQEKPQSWPGLDTDLNGSASH